MRWASVLSRLFYEAVQNLCTLVPITATCIIVASMGYLIKVESGLEIWTKR
jgi:hypothetical protein